jgi:hypothetical protein
MGARDIASGLQSTADFVPTAAAESSIPAATQGLAGNAGQAYGGFDALSGVGEVGGFGYDALPTGISPDQILQAPAGSMIGIKDVAPKTLLGFEVSSPVVKGQVYNPSQLLEMGVTPSTATTMDLAKQKLTDPLTYTPLGVAALTGGFDDPYEYEEPAARPPVDTGFGNYRIVGGEERNPETAKEIQSRMLAGGVRPSYFSPTQRYVRNDAPNETLSIKRNVFDSDKFKNIAEGGIVGLQQGGMPTPQAPSAMAGMLAQPQPQQPLPTNVQVQPQQPVMPQQPQPSMPMPQTGSGVAPLPDQQKEFMKLMDMEDQLQSQKRSQSTQALASLIGLGTNFASNQYPQTSPSGQSVQPPPTPPMNYGSQVNLGATGGFAQGGIINRAEGTKANTWAV